MNQVPRPRPLRRAFTLLELVIVIGIILVLMGLVLGVGSVVIAQSEERQVRSSMQIIDTALLEFEQQAGRPMVFEGWHRTTQAPHAGIRYGDANADIHVDVPFRPMRSTLANGSPNALMNGLDAGGYGWEANGDCFPWDDDLLGRYHEQQWLSAALAVMGRNPACAAILGKCDPKLVRAVVCVTGVGGGIPIEDTFNMTEFIDPWGRQVRMIFPGRRYYETDDAEGSIEIPGYSDYAFPIVRDPDGTIRTPYEHLYGICRNRRPLLVSSGPDGRIGNRFADPTTSSTAENEFNEAQDNIFSYEPLSARSGS